MIGPNNELSPSYKVGSTASKHKLRTLGFRTHSLQIGFHLRPCVNTASQLQQSHYFFMACYRCILKRSGFDVCFTVGLRRDQTENEFRFCRPHKRMSSHGRNLVLSTLVTPSIRLSLCMGGMMMRRIEQHPKLNISRANTYLEREREPLL